jgi:hypothetical protein
LLTLEDQAFELRYVLWPGSSRLQHHSEGIDSLLRAVARWTSSAFFDHASESRYRYPHETSDFHMTELARPNESPHGLWMTSQAIGDFLDRQQFFCSHATSVLD